MALVRVAAVADLHCSRTSQGAFQPLFAAIRDQADVLLLAGDLTDYGLPEEAQILAREMGTLRMPVVAVLGNHDRESGKEAEIRHVLSESGTTVLDGDATEGVAKRICARCEVRRSCLAIALSAPCLEGVWGGLTALERERFRERPPVRPG